MRCQIELAPAVLDDFERIIEHLHAYHVTEAGQRIEQIINAFDLLKTSPNIGRPKNDGKRELLIGEGSRAYVALYRYVAEIKTVFILAVRSQSEEDYR